MKNWVLNFVVLQVCLGLLICVEADKKKKHDKKVPKVHNLDTKNHGKKIDLFYTVTHYENNEFFIDMHKMKSNHHKIQTDELIKSLSIDSDNQKKTPVSFEKIAAYAKKLLKENQELAKTTKGKQLSLLKEGKKKINKIIKNTKKAKKTKKNKKSTNSTKSERHSTKDGNVSTDGRSNELDDVATMFDRADAEAIAADAKKKEAINQNLGEVAPPGTEKPKQLSTSDIKEITPKNTKEFKWGTLDETFPSVQKPTEKPVTILPSQTGIVSIKEKPTELTDNEGNTFSQAFPKVEQKPATHSKDAKYSSEFPALTAAPKPKEGKGKHHHHHRSKKDKLTPQQQKRKEAKAKHGKDYNPQPKKGKKRFRPLSL